MSKLEHTWLVSGTRPGTGATTLAERLSHKFDLMKISSGWIRRAIGLHWSEFSQNKTQTDWQNFQALYQKATSNGTNSLIALLQPYFNQPANEQILAEFSQTQEKFSHHDPFWEFLPDLIGQNILRAGHPSVIEGKLAVLLELIQIDGFPLYQQPELAYPIIKVLLDVSETESARRVLMREIQLAQSRLDTSSPYYQLEPNSHKFDTALEAIRVSNADRLNRDWSHFPYKIDGQQIQPTDLYRGHPIVVDTTSKQPQEVFSLAIATALEKFPTLAIALAHH